MSFFISWEFIGILIAIALVLGAIKLFATWISRDVPDEIQQVICRNCGEPHDIDSLKCPWCGATVQQIYDTKPCGYCRSSYNIEDEVCPNCGTPDKEVYEEKYKPEQ